MYIIIIIIIIIINYTNIIVLLVSSIAYDFIYYCISITQIVFYVRRSC